MAKSVFLVRIEANEYAPLAEMLEKAGYDSELVEEFEGDGDDGIVRGLDALKENETGDKTHVAEQNEDGMITPVDYVYLVKQTQPSSEYYEKTIYVCTDKDEAYRRARELNKDYGNTDSCVFDLDWDFVEMRRDACFECTHYYEVEAIRLNEAFAG